MEQNIHTAGITPAETGTNPSLSGEGQRGPDEQDAEAATLNLTAVLVALTSLGMIAALIWFLGQIANRSLGSG